MQAPSFFGILWGFLLEASLLALGERGAATFAFVMTLICGGVAVFVFLKSASKITELVWSVLRVAFAAFALIALLNALAPSLCTTLVHLFEAALGRKPLLA